MLKPTSCFTSLFWSVRQFTELTAHFVFGVKQVLNAASRCRGNTAGQCRAGPALAGEKVRLEAGRRCEASDCVR